MAGLISRIIFCVAENILNLCLHAAAAFSTENSSLEDPSSPLETFGNQAHNVTPLVMSGEPLAHSD